MNYFLQNLFFLCFKRFTFGLELEKEKQEITRLMQEQQLTFR
jgi:hypothetical protein